MGKLPDDDNSFAIYGKWVYRCDCNKRPWFFELPDGTCYCPNCKKDPNGKIVQVLFREEKLENILNKDKNEN